MKLTFLQSGLHCTIKKLDQLAYVSPGTDQRVIIGKVEEGIVIENVAR